VEHVGVDPADSKPTVVDTAPAVFEEYTGTVRFRPEGIARYVEPPLLIAGIERGRRDDGVRQERAGAVGILLQQKDVIVELAGAAPPATVAGEPDLTDDLDELIFREPEEPLPFRFKSSYLFVECERTSQPPVVTPGTGAGPLPQCWVGRGICPSAILHISPGPSG